ncbi:sulfite exporter TauE/SafE family protein [Nocardioides immobilis]|uniref:Probable membrane transporter protein n=1 Tax=Nocardioides immobilis TaxID=2049295 RepID=A0A417Y7P2_9ACTN|nr:sulfite exporter TauE/SafE family protein [Nocardioides immobilis]RHW28486.1 sulfite exporter TauE/SafE family protein [Nocardioides immobilis]
MTPHEILIVLAAGLGAGLVIAAVGAGSLVSFPLLLSVGLTPLVANVCNTVGLVPGGVSGSYGFRRELAGKRALVRATAVTSASGSLLGAGLLLALPATSFELIVPWLVILAATLIAVQPVISRWLRARAAEQPREVSRDFPAPLGGMSSLIGVYGGYFGAGQGVMLVAFLALGLDEELQVINGLKNVAVLSANLAAALVFAFWAPLDWSIVGLVAIGSVFGGWIGAHIGRRLPPIVFRVLVVVSGYAVGVHLLTT